MPRVAPRDEPAVLVAHGDRETVDLELGDVAEVGLFVGTEEAPYAGVPLPQVFCLAGVGQREHRYGVADLLEALQRFVAYPLGGGVGGDELGVLGLRVLEPA